MALKLLGVSAGDDERRWNTNKSAMARSATATPAPTSQERDTIGPEPS